MLLAMHVEPITKTKVCLLVATSSVAQNPEKIAMRMQNRDAGP
jgi:hypothetical protein